jgi:pectin methylesterase-like acyl-CoA thioesterase
MMKKLAVVVGTLALVTALGVFAAGAVGAQTATPPGQGAPPAGMQGPPPGGSGPDFFGGSTVAFDAQATALNLTPTQLFEQLHSGKTLSQIAEAQGVDLTKVQEAVKAVQAQATKDRISQAVKDGSMTQDQADWLLEGLDKGYTDGGFGGGHMMGRMGPGPRGGGAPGAPPAGVQK